MDMSAYICVCGLCLLFPMAINAQQTKLLWESLHKVKKSFNIVDVGSIRLALFVASKLSLQQRTFLCVEE